MDRPVDFPDLAGLTEPSPSELIADTGGIGSQIRSCQRTELVARVAELFFQPRLQSNTLRIDARRADRSCTEKLFAGHPRCSSSIGRGDGSSCGLNKIR